MYLNLEYFDSLMESKDYTLIDVALISGVSESQLRHMRIGFRNPGEQTMENLLKAFPEAQSDRLFTEDERINEAYFDKKAMEKMKFSSCGKVDRQEVNYILRNYNNEMEKLKEEQKRIKLELEECDFDHVKNYYSGIGIHGEGTDGMTIRNDLLNVLLSCYKTELSYSEHLTQRYLEILRRCEKFRRIYEIYVDLEERYHDVLHYCCLKRMAQKEACDYMYLTKKSMTELKAKALDMVAAIYNTRFVQEEANPVSVLSCGVAS